MINKLVSIFFLNVFLLIYVAQADDVVEIVQEKTVNAKMTDQARQKILDEIVNESTMKYILEFIGQKKYERNKSVIQNKIIKNSGKYILSMKASQPIKTSVGYTTTGTIRFSVKNFQTLLLQEGLLYKFEGSPRILPMLSFEDRVSGERSAWWTEDVEGNGFMNSLSQDFMNSLRTEMWPKGFYSYIPKSPLNSSLIPKSFVIDNPRTDDLMFLGDFLKLKLF